MLVRFVFFQMFYFLLVKASYPVSLYELHFAVHIHSIEYSEYSCAGAILSSSWVLTSANCFSLPGTGIGKYEVRLRIKLRLFYIFLFV